MLLSLAWLREFTPYEGSIEDLAHRLTMVGLEVEEIINPFEHLKGLVVGHVLEKEPHPGADRLSLCRVDPGDGQALSVVCGAPNVKAGQKVPLAPAGTTLPGGVKIKKSKIRGQASQGMICSETELELGTDSSGIMVLDSSIAAGTSLIQALGLEECVLDIGVTPNRPDCLSVLGLARETAAVFNLPLHMPRVSLEEDLSRVCPDEVSIDIEDIKGCPLYQARIIRGCSIGPRPAHIRYRLMSVGIRPINNVVDATNYILMELGQPLHSFDQDLMRGSVVRVARAGRKMSFTTLDQQIRELEPDDLLIWDEDRPVALAGVMGGADTEIHGKSRNVLLECAVFDPLSIRKTASRLGLSSEASFRFERGVDQPGSGFALDRAAFLISSLAGGKTASGVARNEPVPYRRKTLQFRPARAASLLAVEAEAEWCTQTLSRLGCRVETLDRQVLQVEPPSYRPDLEREVDLVEEVGRIFGLDRIPEHLPRIKKSLHEKEPLDQTFEFLSRIKEWARGLGLNEAVNYSFTSNADLDRLNIGKEFRVNIFNPLSEDQDVMRTDLLPGLLQTLRHNLGHGNVRLKIFETARSFLLDQASETGAAETSRLALLLHGPRFVNEWPNPAELFDYTDIKGLLENLMLRFSPGQVWYKTSESHPYLFPAVSFGMGEYDLGFTGRVKGEIAREYKARNEVWFADVNLDTLEKLHSSRETVFTPLPRFPVVKRDMTVIVPADLGYEEIRTAVQKSSIPILEGIVLTDVYMPEGSQEKNMTFRMTYRHPDKTLKDKEVDRAHESLAGLISSALPIRFP